MKVERINADEINMDEILNFQKYITETTHTTYDQLLHQVVCMILGRDVYSHTELQDFSFVTKSDSQRTWLGYKGKIVGEIVFDTKYDEEQIRFSYTFEPKSTLK
jgi:hypothetical protein